MVQLNEKGQANLVIGSDTKYVRRQDVPETFDITTVAYSARPQYILETEHLLDGKVFANIVDRQHAVDIDDALDFEFAEGLYIKRRGGK